MDFFGLAGYIALCMFYPFQLYRMFRYREVRGLSLQALWSLFIGLGLLEISMVAFGAYPLYAYGNGFTLACTIVMLIGCYLFREVHPPKEGAPHA